MRDKRQHCDAISPLNDTHATLSRQFGDIVAWVSHWGYGGAGPWRSRSEIATFISPRMPFSRVKLAKTEPHYNERRPDD